ncbi:MAG: hypothetical protein JXA24_01855 [Proteobacteria bacterium]|nr:hypothetical protein [Pseudomonadota bacterium]
MALHLDQFDVMEYLWSTLEKSPDGRHLRYTEFDVEQLWAMGFVDTARINMQEWKAIFEPMRQADGTFLLTRDQFMSLDRWRYRGEIRIPFDAMMINEGKYTDDGLDELVEASIAPSCILPEAELRASVEKLKEEFRGPDGLILVKGPAKTRIKKLLDKYPSPLRNLEILLNHMLKTKGEEVHDAVERAEIDAVSAAAAMQASSFTAAPATRVEAKAEGLRALEKARRTEKAAEAEGKPKTELRKIRRSVKGMRG